MAGGPPGVNGFGSVVGISAIEEDDALSIWAIGKEPEEVALGFAGFREDDGLLRRAQFRGFGEGDFQGF